MSSSRLTRSMKIVFNIILFLIVFYVFCIKFEMSRQYELVQKLDRYVKGEFVVRDVNYHNIESGSGKYRQVETIRTAIGLLKGVAEVEYDLEHYDFEKVFSSRLSFRGSL